MVWPSGEAMSGLDIKEPDPRPGCDYLEWKNMAPTPEDMPEFKAYCHALKQYFPSRIVDKGESLCGRCILYKPMKEGK